MAEKPTKKDLEKKLDDIDQLIRSRLDASPDQATKDVLLEIREKDQELMNMILAM